MAQMLQLPPKVEYYNVSTDAMRDFRTDRLITPFVHKDEGYVVFTDWFNSEVKRYIDGGFDPRFAAAFVTQDLLQPFVQAVKQ